MRYINLSVVPLSSVLHFTLVLLFAATVWGETPPEIVPWLTEQKWQRDVDGPVLSLGSPGEFDDMHIFAPTVARENGKYLMWYCGSRGFAHDLSPTRTRDERVFSLGLATSIDGRQFVRHPGPVQQLPTPRLSILTPSILRDSKGNVLREQEKMRMWFTSYGMGGGQPHAVQQSSSSDGIQWTDVSPIQLPRAYAPSVLKTDRGYEMWYTEPGAYPLVRQLSSEESRVDWDWIRGQHGRSELA